MSYQIDQSGKIEDTAKNTILAFSNDEQYALFIPKKLKRKIQEVFRLHGFTKVFIYFLFAAGVSVLLEKLKDKHVIIIDTEYPGKERIIRSFLITFLEKLRRPMHTIRFARIGNRPRAHYAAKDVFDKRKKPNRVFTMMDVIVAIKKTDGRLRECLSTLVDARPRSMKKDYHKNNRRSRRNP